MNRLHRPPDGLRSPSRFRGGPRFARLRLAARPLRGLAGCAQLAIAAACLLLAVAPAVAAQDALELRNAVFQEIDVKSADGTMRKERVPAAKVVPGSEIIYVITYHNVGKQPASDVVITNPIPTELAYRPEPLPGPNAAPEVSVDAGKSWGALAKLVVTGDDGKPRPAQGGDVTHVRWKLRAPVKAGEQGSVSYRALLE